MRLFRRENGTIKRYLMNFIGNGLGKEFTTIKLQYINPLETTEDS